MGTVKLKPMHFVENLVYFEGPLTYVTKTDDEKYYLWHWANLTETANIWLVVPTSPENIDKLKNKQTSFRSLFENHKIYYLFKAEFLDMDMIFNEVSAREAEQYFPSVDSKYDYENEVEYFKDL